MVVRLTGHPERGIRRQSEENPRKPRKTLEFTFGAPKRPATGLRRGATKITTHTRKPASYDSVPGRIPILWRTTLRGLAPSAGKVPAQQVRGPSAELCGMVVPRRRCLRRATKPCSRISVAAVFFDTRQTIPSRSAVVRGEPEVCLCLWNR
jgi:hypothetical protein